MPCSRLHLARQTYSWPAPRSAPSRDLRNDLFTKLQTLSLRFFDQRAHGDLMSRLTNDIENINMVLSESITQLISGALTLVGVAVVMLWLNPCLAIVSLITVPTLMIVFTRWVGSHTREGFRRQQAALGTLNGLIEETVTGQRVVKAYGREQTTLDEFNVTNEQLRQRRHACPDLCGLHGADDEL